GVEGLLDNIRSAAVTRGDQRRQLDLLARLNREHQGPRAEDAALEARIQSFELAYRMQTAATDAFDVGREPRRVRRLDGDGVKGGYVHGATDEFGYRAVEKPVHVHDLHATVLHLLGFDHTRLTYRYAGRDFRLTDVAGNVVHEVLA